MCEVITPEARLLAIAIVGLIGWALWYLTTPQS